MKKVRSMVVAILLVAVCIVCFAGCSKKHTAIGKWNFVEMSAEGQTVKAEQMAAMGIQGEMYLEIKEDGNVVFSMGSALEGTYEVKDEKTVTITIEDEPQDAVVDGDKLTMSGEGSSVTFERAK